MKKTAILLAAATAWPPAGVYATNGVNDAKVDSTITLETVTVAAHLSDKSRSALNITTLAPRDLRLAAPAPNYLTALEGIAGVYATTTAGTYGDATLNIRGFKQDNIAVMLNGIPIQGLTSGSMYWSNWMGLMDATHSLQVQKGMGASMLTDCAMGGSLNIVTLAAGERQRASLTSTLTDEGLTKNVLTYSSGLLRGGWSIDAMLSGTTGHGKVECSDVHTLSYMLTIARRFDERNTLSLTALGSPESHDQRTTPLSAAEIERYGRSYSKNWGYLRGEKYSIARNHYFKPYFTLQHLHSGPRLTLRNALYLALADGGGRSTLSARGATPIAGHLTPDGHIDFDAVLMENLAAASGSANNIMVDFLSGHTQAGGLATADYRLTPTLTIGAGAQYQYYSTWQKMKVLDLLGSASWHDDATGAAVQEGDLTGARYGRQTHHASGYGQATLTLPRLTATLGAALFTARYRRRDHLSGESSPWTAATGGSVRGGLVLTLPSPAAFKHSAYLNAALSSRLPYANTALASSSLTVTNDLRNERNILAEAGWRAEWATGSLDLSAYLASWRDKTITVSLARQADEQAEKFQVHGLNALHRGVELAWEQQLLPWLRLHAEAMTASWTWRSDGQAVVYDDYTGQTLAAYTIACDGLHVGDAPQTQLAVRLVARLPKGFHARLAWRLNARMWADFEPSSRLSTTPEREASASRVIDAYRLPASNVVDAVVGWQGHLSRSLRLEAFLTVRNILDATYIERGTDGKGHDRDTFRGFWATPRNAALTLRLSY